MDTSNDGTTASATDIVTHQMSLLRGGRGPSISAAGLGFNYWGLGGGGGGNAPPSRFPPLAGVLGCHPDPTDVTTRHRSAIFIMSISYPYGVNLYCKLK